MLQYLRVLCVRTELLDGPLGASAAEFQYVLKNKMQSFIYLF